MTTNSVNQFLNRLLVLHHRSLPSYLSDARPWTRYTRQAEAQQLLTNIVSDQRRTVDEIGELLTERNHAIQYGEFPLSYTGLNDLSLTFLLKKMLEQQKRNISHIESIVPQLAEDDVARAMAERSLGAAKAHLEMLQRAAEVQVVPAA